MFLLSAASVRGEDEHRSEAGTNASHLCQKISSKVHDNKKRVFVAETKPEAITGQEDEMLVLALNISLSGHCFNKSNKSIEMIPH